MARVVQMTAQSSYMQTLTSCPGVSCPFELPELASLLLRAALLEAS